MKIKRRIDLLECSGVEVEVFICMWVGVRSRPPVFSSGRYRSGANIRRSIPSFSAVFLPFPSTSPAVFGNLSDAVASGETRMN